MSTGQPATKLNEAKHCACACGSLRLGQNECSTRTVGVTELTWFSACGELQLELVSGSVQLLELQKQTRKSEDHKELNLSRFIYIYIHIHILFVYIYIYIYIYSPTVQLGCYKYWRAPQGPGRLAFRALHGE